MRGLLGHGLHASRQSRQRSCALLDIAHSLLDIADVLCGGLYLVGLLCRACGYLLHGVGHIVSSLGYLLGGIRQLARAGAHGDSALFDIRYYGLELAYDGVITPDHDAELVLTAIEPIHRLEAALSQLAQAAVDGLHRLSEGSRHAKRDENSYDQHNYADDHHHHGAPPGL